MAIAGDTSHRYTDERASSLRYIHPTRAVLTEYPSRALRRTFVARALLRIHRNERDSVLDNHS